VLYLLDDGQHGQHQTVKIQNLYVSLAGVPVVHYEHDDDDDDDDDNLLND